MMTTVIIIMMIIIIIIIIIIITIIITMEKDLRRSARIITVSRPESKGYLLLNT